MQLARIEPRFMPLNFDLIRDALLGIENDPRLYERKNIKPDASDPLGVVGRYPEHEVAYHLNVMIDEGLLYGHQAYYLAEMPWISGITWSGHELLRALRPKERSDAINGALAKLGEWTLKILLEIAKIELSKWQNQGTLPPHPGNPPGGVIDT